MLKQKLNKDKAESKIKRGRKKMEDNFRRMTGEGGRGAGGWGPHSPITSYMPGPHFFFAAWPRLVMGIVGHGQQ